MEAEAVDQGEPQTRTSCVWREMQALEWWLVKNKQLQERESGVKREKKSQQFIARL